MLAGIKNILIIVNKGQLSQFKKILPEKNNLGISIRYKEQLKPSGLPEAFTIGENFIGRDKVALILGDNFFYGQSLTNILKKYFFYKWCKNFYSPSKKTRSLWCSFLDKKKKVLKLVEKPKTKSNLAVTGLYFFDNKVIQYTKNLNRLKEVR